MTAAGDGLAAIATGASLPGPMPWLLNLPLLWAGLALPGLALVGAPFTSGAAAKLLAKEALSDSALDAIATLMAIASIGTGALIARFLWRVRLSIDRQPTTAPRLQGWLWLLLASAGAPLWLGWLVNRQLPPLDASQLWSGLWPLLAAILPAALLARRAVDCREIPPGDLLHCLQPPLRWLALTAQRWEGRCARGRDRLEEAVVCIAQATHRKVLRTLPAAELASRYAPHTFAALLMLAA